MYMYLAQFDGNRMSTIFHPTAITIIIILGVCYCICIFLRHFLASRTDITSILLAARNGNLERVQRLVEEKPKLVNASNLGDGRVPLSEALIHGHEAVALYLLDNGASISKGSSQYGTPLTYAASNGLAKASKALIAKGCDVNHKNFDKETPLHYAAASGSVETAMLLTLHGADVNAYDCGNTPLHRAVEKDKIPMIEFLLSIGAHSNAKDFRGRTPLQIAKEHQNINSIKLLDVQSTR